VKKTSPIIGEEEEEEEEEGYQFVYQFGTGSNRPKFIST
jgi:hypothetical protein